MKQQWVLRLPVENVATLGHLRLIPGIQVAESPSHLWLRGSQMDERLSRLLRSIPDGEIFTLMEEQQLVPAGKHVPQGYLPTGEWTPIQAWYSVQLEKSSLAGISTERIALELKRSQTTQPANVVVTSLVQLSEFVSHCAQVRLAPLLYVVDAQQRAVIYGSPLPPIEGTHFCESKGVAVEAGWTWTPPVNAEVLRDLFQLSKGDLVLLHSDQSREVIRADQFVRLSRSSVRLSLQQFVKTSEPNF
ncbi:hypothetical protein Pan241w_17460 [Gimesia alba]|uniref:MoxR-vWA-beta-propeller ternary system domain-containing protein n=1 Tax=Gimesia alba TaxID=2527973 RepID=A0A517RCW3_9PLAN|nr:hypothetical protein [Gimesia alba]QDT41683.1 hypothetical protein Pan241w_17460 [Gimesia alba]